MLKDLTGIEVKVPDFVNLKEITLSDNLQVQIKNVFEGALNITFNPHTTVIERDNHNFIIMPNQYFQMAVCCKEFASELIKYYLIFDEKLRRIANTTADLQTSINTNLTEYDSEDRQLFFRFLTDITFTSNAKSIKDSSGYRGSKDHFGSVILKKFPIPDASSGIFGELVYYLSKVPAVYALLEKEVQTQIVSSPKPAVSSKTFTKNFEQIIYYGVPGSGKSFAIDNLIKEKVHNKEEREEQVLRVVFHPEYSNADFVGQILPKFDEKQSKIDYFFNPGPFTNILKKAYTNPDKPYYLIIEEINRGNAAAIFGELFQLLDRAEDGMSVYSVNNDDINYELRKDIEELGWDENTGIRLPSNLALLATMNTSDQNVFTLDNAFQRRWSMKLIENKFGNSDEENTQKSSIIENTDITWEYFQSRINEEIGRLSAETGLSSMEDKRLG